MNLRDARKALAAMTHPDHDAIARRFYREVVEEGRPDVAEDLFSYRDFASDAGAVIRGIAEIHAAIPDLVVDLDSVTVAGSEVRVEAVLRGTHVRDLAGTPATGEQIEIVVSDTFHVVEGRIASYESRISAPGLLQFSPLPGYPDLDPPRTDDEDETGAEEDDSALPGNSDVDDLELVGDANYSPLPGDPDVDPPKPDDEDVSA